MEDEGTRMTAWELIQHLTMSVAASASFGNVNLWWSEKNRQLYVSKRPPTQDAECLNNASLNVGRLA